MREPDRHCWEHRPTRLGTGWYLQGRAGLFPLAPLAQGWEDLARHRSGRSEQRPASPVSPQGTRPTYLTDSSQAPERTKAKSRLGEGLPSPVPSGGGGGRRLGVGNAEKKGGAWGWVCARGSAPRSAPHSAGPALGALGKEGVIAAGIRGSLEKPSQSDAPERS